jgi:hypothetical protein
MKVGLRLGYLKKMFSYVTYKGLKMCKSLKCVMNVVEKIKVFCR